MARIARRKISMVVAGLAGAGAVAVVVLQVGDEPEADEQAARRQAAEVASCLRRHGADVDTADVQVGADGGIELPSPEDDAGAEELRSALEGCAGEPGWEPPVPTDHELEHALDGARSYVECLDAEGVELPDPVVIDGQVYFGDEQQTELRNLDTDDPEVVAALEACDPQA